MDPDDLDYIVQFKVRASTLDTAQEDPLTEFPATLTDCGLNSKVVLTETVLSIIRDDASKKKKIRRPPSRAKVKDEDESEDKSSIIYSTNLFNIHKIILKTETVLEFSDFEDYIILVLGFETPSDCTTFFTALKKIYFGFSMEKKYLEEGYIFDFARDGTEVVIKKITAPILKGNNTNNSSNNENENKETALNTTVLAIDGRPVSFTNNIDTSGIDETSVRIDNSYNRDGSYNNKQDGENNNELIISNAHAQYEPWRESSGTSFDIDRVISILEDPGFLKYVDEIEQLLNEWVK